MLPVSQTTLTVAQSLTPTLVLRIALTNCTLALHVNFRILFCFCEECYWSIRNIKIY